MPPTRSRFGFYEKMENLRWNASDQKGKLQAQITEMPSINPAVAFLENAVANYEGVIENIDQALSIQGQLEGRATE